MALFLQAARSTATGQYVHDKGNPLNYRDDIDIIVFRENTQGLYSGVEFSPLTKIVYDALMTHPKMKKFKNIPLDEIAISTRIFTKKVCRNIITQGFEYAKKFKIISTRKRHYIKYKFPKGFVKDHHIYHGAKGYLFLVELFSKRIKVDRSEHDRHLWVSKDEAMEILTHENHKNALEYVWERHKLS